MGNAYNFCTGMDGNQEIVVFGDHFNADTRSIINILRMSDISYKLDEVDTLDLNCESEKRQNYMKK